MYYIGRYIAALREEIYYCGGKPGGEPQVQEPSAY